MWNTPTPGSCGMVCSYRTMFHNLNYIGAIDPTGAGRVSYVTLKSKNIFTNEKNKLKQRETNQGARALIVSGSIVLLGFQNHCVNVK